MARSVRLGSIGIAGITLLLVASCGESSGGSTASGGSAGTSTGGRSATGGGSGASGKAGRAGSSGVGGTSPGGRGGAGGASGGTAGGGGAGGSAGIGGGPSLPGGACTTPVNPPASAPCSDGPPKLSYCKKSSPSDVIMTICESHGLSQCDAGEACGTGWHLCTATEYRDRGGRDVPDNVTIVGSWIAGCARDTRTEFRDGICSICGSESAAPPAMIYECDGSDIGPGMVGDGIGVVSGRECKRVGENTALTAAYWSIYWTDSRAAHSMCCLDQP
jgi:hypothetical protein